MKEEDFLVQTWEESYSSALAMFQMVKESGFIPDVILGVARGGWVPARLLADFFRIKETANIKIDFYNDINTRDEEPRITQAAPDLSGKKVLIVDDVADTGKSLQKVVEQLESMKDCEYRTLTIYYKPHSIIKPDYYLVETEKWVVFGWERFEFISQFKNLMEKKGVGEREILQKLKKLGIHPGEIEIFFDYYHDRT
ncbi:MAG: phosphoribosyltransferase [Methanobacteriota archaeon]|nr:MAG: phosphoribosyltransferase [Euryarchaeota archaeon]